MNIYGKLWAVNGATSWGLQVGRLVVEFVKPRYWLYGRTPGYGRTWFYNTPVRVWLEEKPDATD